VHNNIDRTKKRVLRGGDKPYDCDMCDRTYCCECDYKQHLTTLLHIGNQRQADTMTSSN